ncbi:MAG: transglutaminase-like domain-containing protein [Gammaproteobacteria bacterium]|nr:transglutaminase-like domain-containing protein [Gammaproteobacteria bacterium]MBU1442260.1 transglutaminase-like domain-containing protein [Gammaproteobacteria bacterium]MBU2286175.1 transglutaminase-like domain-containing protein [Gammaproteobacteria bacterium]MBU2407105.1 transglutaminase-like domain-containing protein [Gammaproteobacteria bacterium]
MAASFHCVPAAAQWLDTAMPNVAGFRSLAADAQIRELDALLKQPESSMDLARVKLAIDHMIDPGIDVARTLAQLDAMANEVRKLYAADASKQTAVEALRAYLHGPDPQRARPFHYDLDDPSGTKVSNKLLSTYLRTKKGNCVSMPILFVILGQKLGIDVTLARAPEHLFVKYRDPQGRDINLETTSGGFPRMDSSYQRDTPMTPTALSRGVYMRALSKKEAAAAMVETLRQHYYEKGEVPRALAAATIMLEHSPNDAETMQSMSYGYWLLEKKDFQSKYPNPNTIPHELRPYFRDLQAKQALWLNKAQALGWREPDRAQQDRYRQIVDKARSASQ